jgi:hypothetical protein
MHVAHHADHIGLGAATVGGVHDDVALRGELAEQWAGEDVLVEEVPRTAVQVDDGGARTLHLYRWLPDVRDELPVGAGNGPEGNVAVPPWRRHPWQAHRSATPEHSPVRTGWDPLLPVRTERLLETVMGTGHPGDVVRRDARGEPAGDNGEP